MRNTLSTVRALARCDHALHVEGIVIEGESVSRCTYCGARAEPADHEHPQPAKWNRPELVERLERDLSDELPIFMMDLEEVERSCHEIVSSLEKVKRGDLVIEPGAVSSIIEAAQGCRTTLARLRRTFDGDKGGP
jgi:hypothetical protein